MLRISAVTRKCNIFCFNNSSYITIKKIQLVNAHICEYGLWLNFECGCITLIFNWCLKCSKWWLYIYIYIQESGACLIYFFLTTCWPQQETWAFLYNNKYTQILPGVTQEKWVQYRIINGCTVPYMTTFAKRIWTQVAALCQSVP